MSTSTSISRNVLNIDICIADTGYEIVLKKNRGMSAISLENKLALMVNLRKMLSWTPSSKKYNTETGRIESCGSEIIPNPSNDVLDSTETGCITIAESCCITSCDINKKMKSICNIC